MNAKLKSPLSWSVNRPVRAAVRLQPKKSPREALKTAFTVSSSISERTKERRGNDTHAPKANGFFFSPDDSETINGVNYRT